MDKQLVTKLKTTFDSIAHVAEDGLEYWLARELQAVLGYVKWDKFQNVIEKAENACENSGSAVRDHFLQVGKLVSIGSEVYHEEAWAE